jgi:ribosomal protein S18 acetylase RimI-like enzyme
MPVIEDWCAKEKIRCAYLLVGSEDAETIRVAEDHHFHLADLRLTLERRLLGDLAMPTCVRPALESDLPEIVSMARVNHTDSRFYYDPGFPRERCDALYATWAEKSCRGWADAVFVAEQDGRTAGYITCHDDKTWGRIGLVGVAEWARGGGLGRELLQASLSFFGSRKLPFVTVVTQLRNVGAQRLYQRNGFVARSLELWYHRWF